MGALQRYECQQYSIDQKKTLFGMTVDAESAFDIVSRPILLQELYNAGEQGQMWQYTKANYENTTCKVKMNGKLSRSFEEVLGVGQGKCRAADHFKIFINLCLDSLDKSELGIWMGKYCINS